MKPQILSLVLAFMLISHVDTFAQIKPVKVNKAKTIKVNKNTKRAPLKIKRNKKTQKAVTRINKVNDRKCLPISMSRVEYIIRDKIARDLSLYLDKDYAYIEIMREKKDLNIGKYKVKKPGNDWRYHLNDVKSTNTRITINRGQTILTVFFESERSEIKGKCPGCRVGNDKRAPDINWKNPKLRILLKPVAFNNLLTFDVERVVMGGKLKPNGAMGKFMPSITHYFKKQIEKAVERELKQTLNKPDIKNMLGNAFRSEVDKIGIDKVLSVDDTRDKLYLCNYSKTGEVMQAKKY